MREVYRDLYALQQIDSEIQRLERLRVEIPERIKEIEELIKNKEDEILEKKKTLDLLEQRRLKTEREIEEEKMKLENYKKQQFEVKTNEAYQALLKEMEYSKRKIETLEMEYLVIEEDLNRKRKEVAEETKALIEEKKRMENEKKKLEEEFSTLDEKIMLKKDERKRASSRLDPKLLARYERLIVSRGGLAVVVIEEAMCGGCFATLPPQYFQEIRKGERIYTCEYCGRILIYKDFVV
ncbi:hypothetical protein DRQ20_07580 [bacterium]|nr:MAG: hypothetical protein DRQ20_07580 [bacterium]